MDNHPFACHHAWTAVAPAAPDCLTAVGNFNPDYDPTKSSDDAPVRKGRPVDKDGRYDVRLNEALRFNDANNVARDLPASETIGVALPDLLGSSDPYGGKYVELLLPYLLASGNPNFNQPYNARDVLPPPLHREGEAEQPTWLHDFHLNPKTIEPPRILNLSRCNR